MTGTTPGTATPANGVGTGTGPERRENLRLDYKAKSLFTAILGAESVVDRLTLAYAGAYGHNKVLDHYPLWQFRCNPGTVDFDFSKEIYTAVPRTECTPQQMQFRQPTRAIATFRAIHHPDDPRTTAYDLAKFHIENGNSALLSCTRRARSVGDAGGLLAASRRRLRVQVG